MWRKNKNHTTYLHYCSLTFILLQKNNPCPNCTSEEVNNHRRSVVAQAIITRCHSSTLHTEVEETFGLNTWMAERRTRCQARVLAILEKNLDKKFGQNHFMFMHTRSGKQRSKSRRRGGGCAGKEGEREGGMEGGGAGGEG